VLAVIKAFGGQYRVDIVLFRLVIYFCRIRKHVSFDTYSKEFE
jgi:hypothetical protein